MAKTKIQFQYSEIRSFEEPLTISMEVPERSIEEMCEYFQRFLSACGYIFDEGEYISPIKKDKKAESSAIGAAQPPSGIDGFYFGGEDHIAFSGSHVRGGMGEDIISFS